MVGMFSWIKRLFAGSHSPKRPEPAGISEYDLSPSGKYTLTLGGCTVIRRPHLRNDHIADAFEDRLLTWLQATLGVKPISWAGTGTLFWKFEFKDHTIELAVIGRRKNTCTPPSASIDWIIRVEEEEPLEFVPVLERCFTAVNRVRRKMSDDCKVRVQFKSTELLPDSELA